MKKLLVIAVLFTSMVAAAFATPAGAITDYMFGVDGDGYMETQWYVYAGFKKFIASTEFDAAKTSLGFATKFGAAEDGNGGLYLGISYGGTIFNQRDINGYTEAEGAWNTATKTFKTYAAPSFAATGPDHNIGILIGVAEMGFKFTIGTTYQIFEVNEDAQIGGTATERYKSYKAEYGDVNPAIRWGMAKDLTSKGIRPSVEVSLGFHTDQLAYEQYGTYGTSYTTPGVFTSGSTNGATNNYSNFGLHLWLGGLNLVSTDSGFNFSFDFEYAVSSDTYGENQKSWYYLAPGATVPTVMTFKDTVRFTTGTTFDTDIKAASHNIEPSLKATWSSEKIGVGAQLHLPIGISSDEHTANSGTFTGASNTVTKGAKVVKTDVIFKPRLNLGGQVKVVPNKFNVNLGATLALSTVGETKTETTSDTGKTTTVVAPATTASSSAFSVGATLFFTENVALDAKTGVDNRTNTNGFNFFGTGAGSITFFNSFYLQVRF
jgi:hypothetical protein